LHGKPVVIDDIVLPEALFAGLTEPMLRQRAGTLYSLYQAEFGLNVIRIEERLRAALATPEQATLLQLAPGAPLLEIRRIAFSYNNQPVEWRISHIDTRQYEYLANEM
ncbi:MAG: GntR family transcriptional regulator, partial [Burkholderiaceae bacterium]